MPKVPQGPDWKQILEAGMQFTEMRRSQARSLAADLVAHGHLARDQMAATVDEFVELSRRRTSDLRKIVQTEVARQLSTVGIATKQDLAALERRLTKASREAKKAPGKKKASKNPATAKKATRKAG